MASLHQRVVRRVALGAALALVYFVAAKLGLKIASIHASASPVWAPTGIAIAALLRLGGGGWAGIFLGAFTANFTNVGSLATSLGIAAGNTLEAVLAATLITRFASGPRVAERAEAIFKFTLIVLLSTTVSATVGVASLSLGGFAAWDRFSSIWYTWWLGDAVGGLVVAPFLLLWTAGPPPGWKASRAVEATALLACLTLVGLTVFSGLLPTRSSNYPLGFLCPPVLVWAVFRFGKRVAAAAIVLLSGIAIWGTLGGLGPFVQPSSNESLLLLQAFIAVSAVTILVLAAVVSERRVAEAQLRDLAEHDPLTGLANYRHLLEVMERELVRSGRTGRPFSILFLDLNGLKQINDRHGHAAGNRALCTVAGALRASCRELDVAARYGGDEFAVVLPETARETARMVASRIEALLAQEKQEPLVSVSMGVSEYPGDGDSPAALLAAADALLYEVKREAKRRAPKPSTA